MIDISGIDKAELLAALVNAAEPHGFGVLSAGSSPMTRDEAKLWIDSDRFHDDAIVPGHPSWHLRFDYVRGRCLKVDLNGDVLHTLRYDEINGPGAAARVVAELRARRP